MFGVELTHTNWNMLSLAALHRMWSGGGLALKDSEKKKKQNGHTLLVDEESTNENT